MGTFELAKDWKVQEYNGVEWVTVKEFGVETHAISYINTPRSLRVVQSALVVVEEKEKGSL